MFIQVFFFFSVQLFVITRSWTVFIELNQSNVKFMLFLIKTKRWRKSKIIIDNNLLFVKHSPSISTHMWINKSMNKYYKKQSKTTRAKVKYKKRQLKISLIQLTTKSFIRSIVQSIIFYWKFECVRVSFWKSVRFRSQFHILTTRFDS